MKLSDYINDVKLELTGGILNLELEDKAIAAVIDKALREIQRYSDETRFMTIPFSRCIDLSDTEVSRVVSVYRTEATGAGSSAESSMMDPMYAQMGALYSNGTSMYNLKDGILNYAAYNTLNQLENTASTDLAFIYDNQENKIYINVLDNPSTITIEYVPVYKSVEDVKSAYGQDILRRLTVASTKVILGRIRSRFTQTNALWAQDGEQMLAEGNEELKELREIMRVNASMMLPID